MASTAISDPKLMEERRDPKEVLEQKVDRLAVMVQESRHFVAFTGAGISTSAGIHDFRGPNGKWTRQAEGKAPLKGVEVIKAYPTPTHMSLVELQRRGVLKYLISQNCDGLHRRSGIPAWAISELHGNGCVEICEDCGQQHVRDFKCSRITRPGGAANPTDHFTGRLCRCGGRLLNSTIDFGQGLPERPLELAREHSRLADLHLALGSSLSVPPARDNPKMTAAAGGKLVICNLQETPLTSIATMQIYAETDVVMEMLMQRLRLFIPPFRLTRRVVIGRRSDATVYAKSVDVHDPSFEVGQIRAVEWGGNGVQQDTVQGQQADVPLHMGAHCSRVSGGLQDLVATLHWFGHYNEPELALIVDLSSARAVDFNLSFDPYELSWTCLSKESLQDDQLRAPTDAAAAQIPDYGYSHREYCVSKVMQSRNCDLKTAEEIIDTRFRESKRDAATGKRQALPPSKVMAKPVAKQQASPRRHR